MNSEDAAKVAARLDGIEEQARRQADATERAADAAERTAVALEDLVALARKGMAVHEPDTGFGDLPQG